MRSADLCLFEQRRVEQPFGVILPPSGLNILNRIRIVNDARLMAARVAWATISANVSLASTEISSDELYGYERRALSGGGRRASRIRGCEILFGAKGVPMLDPTLQSDAIPLYVAEPKPPFISRLMADKRCVDAAATSVAMPLVFRQEQLD
jgi:hypothetical protein